MFVGNTTLIRTVNDTLSTSSSKRLSTFTPLNNQDYLSSIDFNSEINHYDEIDFQQKVKANSFLSILNSRCFFSVVKTGETATEDSQSCSYTSSYPGGLNSDEISSAVSNDYCQTEEEEEEDAYESIYELDLIIEQVRTCLDDLRVTDRSFSLIFDQIEETLNRLDEIIKSEIHQQTEKTLEIENILEDFHFLNTYDNDQDTLKTIDSGFEGEQQQQNQHFKSIIHLIFVDILNRILILLHVKKNQNEIIFL